MDADTVGSGVYVLNSYVTLCAASFPFIAFSQTRSQSFSFLLLQQTVSARDI